MIKGLTLQQRPATAGLRNPAVRCHATAVAGALANKHL